MISSTNSPSDYPEWSSLPPHLVFLILDKLFEPLDHVRVRAVCKQWHSLSQEYNGKTQRWHSTPPPMLMILTRPTRKRGFGSTTTSKPTGVLYSAAEGTVYTNIRLSIPDHLSNHNQFCCSCGHGWLAKVEPHENVGQSRITLFNPFEKTVEITLPPLHCPYEHNQDYGKMKLILSADPNLNPDNYVIIIILLDCNGRSGFRFLTSPKMSWTDNIRVNNNIYDAVFHKGKVYAVSESLVYVFEVELNYVVLQRVYERGRVGSSRKPNCDKYLVESTEGELLYVRGPDVYKLVFEEGVNKVAEVKVESIGDEALFLGYHPSLAISASDKFRGCQPNCIYFSSELAWICVYDLKDKTRSRYPKPQDVHIKRTFWITPPFRGLC